MQQCGWRLIYPHFGAILVCWLIAFTQAKKMRETSFPKTARFGGEAGATSKSANVG
jgi:hypothetical protein